MTRREIRLERPPKDPRRLRAFPRTELSSTTPLFRVNREGRNPWWFNSSGAGRFDLSSPDGTCYLATDWITALLEVLGPDRDGGLVSAEFLAERRLHELRVPEDRSLADLTQRQAARYGITLEIHSLPDDEVTQAWARALSSADAEGLRYFARHDPAAGHSIALFGPQGERDWDQGCEHRLDDRASSSRLWTTCRILVARRPYKNEIPILD